MGRGDRNTDWDLKNRERKVKKQDASWFVGIPLEWRFSLYSSGLSLGSLVKQTEVQALLTHVDPWQLNHSSASLRAERSPT